MIMDSTNFWLPNIYELGYRAGQATIHLYWFITTDPTASSSSSADVIGETEAADEAAAATTSSTTLVSAATIYETIVNFPALYKAWWLDLFANNPMHVIVETTLLLSLLYIFVSRSNDWRDNDREKLTAAEQHELLVEWKDHIRAPLTPGQSYPDDDSEDEEDDDMEDDSNNNNEEEYHEVQGNNNNNSRTADNNDRQQQNVFTQYNPADDCVVHAVDGRTMDMDLLIPVSTSTSPTKTNKTAEGAVQRVRKTVLNFASFDFLGRSANALPPPPPAIDSDEKKLPDEADRAEPNPVKEVALSALDKYGCGSCGPRGFYGTIDVHLQLEKQYSSWLETDDAILYSDGASTCSSTVAAFCKRGDLIVADSALSEPLVTGLTLSRAHVKWFAHNDMDDLRSVLTKVQDADRARGRKPAAQRRFLLVEGLYKNTGRICPLKEVVQLKHEFHYRLIVDESMSLGVLGPNGRGVAEMYQCKRMHDIEITTASLENAIGSIGGMSAGSSEVVDHQRLSGSGYCFSASSPPFAATAAMKSIHLMNQRPDLLQRLHAIRTYFMNAIEKAMRNEDHHDNASLASTLQLVSDEKSPLIFMKVVRRNRRRDSNSKKQLQNTTASAATKKKSGDNSNSSSGDFDDDSTVAATGGDSHNDDSSDDDSLEVVEDEDAHALVMRIVRHALLLGVAMVATGPPNPRWVGPHHSATKNKRKSRQWQSKTAGTGAAAGSNSGMLSRTSPPVGIRITVSVCHTIQDLDTAVQVLQQAIRLAKKDS